MLGDDPRDRGEQSPLAPDHPGERPAVVARVHATVGEHVVGRDPLPDRGDVVAQLADLGHHVRRGDGDVEVERPAAGDLLDQANLLILGIKTDESDDLIQQKEDLRFMISKRILEIYASRNIVVNGNQSLLFSVFHNLIDNVILG